MHLPTKKLRLLAATNVSIKRYPILLAFYVILVVLVLIAVYHCPTNLGNVSSWRNISASLISEWNNTGSVMQNDGKKKILCWITTCSQFHSSRAIAVKETWAKRCDKYIFISDEDDADLPAIGVSTSLGRQFLWNKTRRALSYIYERYYNNFGWFLKADDDTYVVVENLRSFLLSKDANSALYYGCLIRFHVNKQGYMSGGAGYVLSRAALKKFFAEALKDPNKCDVNGDYEDVEMGKCLENIGVPVGDSRDEHNRHRFVPIPLEKLLIWKENDEVAHWFQKYSMYPIKKGIKEVSDSLITVHYVTPEMMRLLDFLLYNVRSPAS